MSRGLNIQYFCAGAPLPSAIGRLRYEVYVEQRGLENLLGADHVNRTYQCRDDHLGHFQVAFEDGEVVGLVRGLYARDIPDGHEFVRLFGMNDLPRDQRMKASISTQLMVKGNPARPTLGARLVRALYRQSTSDGMGWDFLDCNAELEPFFLRFGYRRHLGLIDRPGIGQVVSMVLDAADREFLKSVRSPFARDFPEAAAMP